MIKRDKIFFKKGTFYLTKTKMHLQLLLKNVILFIPITTKYLSNLYQNQEKEEADLNDMKLIFNTDTQKHTDTTTDLIKKNIQHQSKPRKIPHSGTFEIIMTVDLIDKQSKNHDKLVRKYS